jgi:hypothetical protein
MNYFDKTFIDNLKKAINRLYDRDKRIGLFPKDFWIVDKSIESEHFKTENLINMIP